MTDDATRGGRVLKVVSLGDEGESQTEWSQQLPEDPFRTAYRTAGVVEPPYSLEQLMFLAEQHPTHAAAIEQKAADVVGVGWRWDPRDKKAEGGDRDDAEKQKLEDWFASLAASEKDDTTHEVLLSAWDDLETFGQGFIEIARDRGKDRRVRHWYRAPAHTFRFHKDGVRILQQRNERRRWFKRWIPGDDRVVDASNGKIGKPSEIKRPANELFVLKRPSRRSSWYGIPRYVSATGWITLSCAARDDNVLYFENRREPRWVIILENVEDDPSLESQISEALRSGHKEPHRNLVLPLTAPAKATFQKLGSDGMDGSWDKLQDRVDSAVLLAHRIPPERVGVVRVGPMGGNVVTAATKVYKEGFVQTSQQILATRMQRFIEHEGPVDRPKWLWVPNELNLTEKGADQQGAVTGFGGNVLKLNEARRAYGVDELDEKDDRGDKFAFELVKPGQQTLPPDSAAAQAAQQELAARIEQMIGGPGGGSDENEV